MNGHRKSVAALVLAIVLAGTSTAAVAQQVPPQPPPAAAPAAGGAVVVSKPIWPGAAITAIACGAALFAVCRSSARN